MKEYWMQLKPRERQMLSIGGGFLLLIIIYLLIIEPLFQSTDRLQQQVSEQEKLVSWMQEAVVEAKQLQRAGSGNKRSRGGQSLLSLVDSTAKQGRLGDVVKRVEPDGNRRVRVWLERASFDDIMRWVESLQNNYGIEVDTVVVDKEEALGRVNARVTFQGAA